MHIKEVSDTPYIQHDEWITKLENNSWNRCHLHDDGEMIM